MKILAHCTLRMRKRPKVLIVCANVYLVPVQQGGAAQTAYFLVSKTH